MTTDIRATFARETSPGEPNSLRKIFLDVDDQTRRSGDAFWLQRLARLVRLDSPPGIRDDNAKLVRRAIYSTYLDCRAAGVEELARAIILRQWAT